MMMGGNGPGTRSANGCVFKSSLGGIAFERIAKTSPEKAVTAMAFDAATASSEIGGNVIGMYRLKVKEVEYEDKITGELVRETTLVSPDFNDEPVGIWTDAGEYGTGTVADYRRIVSRARNLANSNTDTSMFWVSPGSDESHEVTPHRAYLWVKKDDEVTAYSYSLSGKKENLLKLMDNLDSGKADTKEPIYDRTIIKKDTHLTHEDVFEAFTKSLSYEDLDKSKAFVNQFRQEVEMPDTVRDKGLEENQKKYEKKIREDYKKDIKQALESIAVGMLGLSKPDSSNHTPHSVSADETEINIKHLPWIVQLVPAYIGVMGMMSLPVYENNSELHNLQLIFNEKSDDKSLLEHVNTNSDKRIPSDIYIPYFLNNPEKPEIEVINNTGEFSDLIFTDSQDKITFLQNLTDLEELFRRNDFRVENIEQNKPIIDPYDNLPESVDLESIIQRLNNFTESSGTEPAQISEADLFIIERSVDVLLRFVANALIHSKGNEMSFPEFIPVNKVFMIIETAKKLFTYLQKADISSFVHEDKELSKHHMITLLKIELFMDLYKDYDKDKDVKNLILLLIFREIILIKNNPLISDIPSKNLLPDLLDNDQTTDLYKRLNMFETIVNNLKDSTQLQVFKSIFIALFLLDSSIKDMDLSIRIIKMLLSLRLKIRNHNNSIERIFPYRNYKMNMTLTKLKNKKKYFPKSALIYRAVINII